MLLGQKEPFVSCLQSISHAEWRSPRASACQDYVFRTLVKMHGLPHTMPPMLVRMKGRHEDTVKTRPCWSLRRQLLVLTRRAYLKTAVRDLIASSCEAESVPRKWSKVLQWGLRILLDTQLLLCRQKNQWLTPCFWWCISHGYGQWSCSLYHVVSHKWA